MKISRNIPQQIIAGATALLQPYCQELSASNLVEALQAYGKEPEPPKPVQDLLTIKQTAQALQLSVMTVRRLIDSGKLPKTTIGTRGVRIPANAINEMIGERGF